MAWYRQSFPAGSHDTGNFQSPEHWAGATVELPAASPAAPVTSFPAGFSSVRFHNSSNNNNNNNNNNEPTIPIDAINVINADQLPTKVMTATPRWSPALP